MPKQHIFVNGRIFTSSRSHPYAEAMIVENGNISWIGAQKDLPSLSCPTTDLKGRRIIPGFADVHMHPVLLADCRKKITVMPPDIVSIQDLIQAVCRRRKEQRAGEWIEGWGYDEEGLLEKRAPNRYDLDQGSEDSPVIIMRTCAHICSVNSAALALAGIDQDTPDPPGGQIDRDEKGNPTGILRENARNLVTDLIPPVSMEKQVQNLLELGEILTSQGITAVCDMGILGPGDNFPIFEAAAAKGFRQKTGVYRMWDFFADDPSFSIPPEMLDRERQIFAAGIKLIGDGSVSGRTAWMERPYLGSKTEAGFPVCSDELLESAIRFCKKNRCQLSMHAMGGRAIERIVNRASREFSWTGGGIPYVRVEHVTEPSAQSIQRAAAHGISFVTQPIFPYAEIASYLKNLGSGRVKECYPIRRLLEMGINLGFSTDAPATFWATPSDPFPGLKFAVTRRAADGTDCGRDQAVSIQTALYLYTRGACLAAGIPRCGMLSPGYRADFAALSEDILKTPPEQIDRVRVTGTWIGGELAYGQED